MIYVVAFILILYSWILVDLKHYRKLSSVCICVIIVFLILIAGLRYRVGGDSLHYIDTYTSMPTWKNWEFFSFDEGYGPLWYLFCAISKTLGADFVYLQLLHAIGKFYQFNLSSCIRQQNSLTSQFVSFSLSNLANIFYPPPIFTIINLCLL